MAPALIASNPLFRNVSLLAAACAFAAGCANVRDREEMPKAAQSAAVQLNALLDEDLDAVFRRGPFMATVRGVPGYNHLLPDLSLAALEREHAREQSMLAKLRAIDPGALQGQDRVSYELLLDKTARAVESQRFRDSRALVLSTGFGVQSTMPRASETTPFHTAEDYRDYIKRLSGMPAMTGQLIERLQQGLRTGWMSTKPVVDRVIAGIDAHIVDNVDQSILLRPFQRFPAAIAATERAALAAEARRAVETGYQPALRRVRAWLASEYRPKAPDDAGLAALPGGAEYYEFLIRSRVVPGMSAREIHELGLRQVARIRNEIGAVARQAGFSGSADEFITYLRTDRKFFFSSADAVLAAYRSMPPRVEPHLAKFFRVLPRMPYAVRAMTPAESVSSTAANYTIGSLELGTSAYFTINALGYANEATWRRETLFLHEAVPGHHLQNARAAEMEGLHPWRSMGGSYNVAYGEGWALYAETLGFDLGLYTDPYQHYGHLQAQLFRAARLVVDTGIHAFNWPRGKAIEYMKTQGGVDEHFAVSEVDRYFSGPSQALGYMLGKLRFLELRAKAEKALGARFDVRDFHAVCIDNGPMPFAVLEKLVDAWIARTSRS